QNDASKRKHVTTTSSSSDTNFIESECSFSCDSGYARVGSAVSTCLDDFDGNLLGAWSSIAPSCLPITCIPAQIDPLNGAVSCTNSNFLSSRCSFTCSVGFALVGSDVLTCNDDLDGDTLGAWDNVAPSCQPITCLPRYTSLINGAVSCTNTNFYASECVFTCDQNYVMNGNSVLTCGEGVPGNVIGAW
uniref:Sushi domain-containing protein n=1 Tax=Ciona savignyi TaxID=51511 RepID=H2ZPL2_CIOSA